MITLAVFWTVRATASLSYGNNERKSTTSSEMPSGASVSAAARASCTIAPYVMTEIVSPWRASRATPMGTVKSPSGTSSLMRRYRRLCSKKMVGSGSRMADLSRPFVSYAVLGASTFRPGTCA